MIETLVSFSNLEFHSHHNLCPNILLFYFVLSNVLFYACSSTINYTPFNPPLVKEVRVTSLYWVERDSLKIQLTIFLKVFLACKKIGERTK